MRIRREDAIAIVIDVQDKLFHHIAGYDELAGTLLILTRGLRALAVPMILSEQYVKGLGDTIEPMRSELVNCPRFEKLHFSCVANEELMAELRGKKSVILCGIESHVCVLQTAIDLKALGYDPIVVENCIGSRDDRDHQIAIKRLQHEGIPLATYESILFELCVVAGTPEFKEISRSVK